jgi:hypothetical protein
VDGAAKDCRAGADGPDGRELVDYRDGPDRADSVDGLVGQDRQVRAADSLR